MVKLVFHFAFQGGFVTDLTLQEIKKLSVKELSKFLEEEAHKMFGHGPPKKHAGGVNNDLSSLLESAALKDRVKSPFTCLLSFFLSHSRKLCRISIRRKA